ncbi:BMC domain-containing protein [Paenibacillus oryzisoli]|uniref:BMC domain-containing protein n=1 Tax=Paenibacillus oryzisoli TaxID=1850517 RepID=UPI003D2C130D
MSEALGMIETRGFIASIEAADAMIKSSNVKLVRQESADAGLMTILVSGDVGAVQAALEAGKEAAKRVGVLVAAHMIARPDDEVNHLLQKNEMTDSASQQRGDTTKNNAGRKRTELSPNSDHKTDTE